MTEDPLEVTREAGLRYVNDALPGITRHRAGKHFQYRQANGRPIRNRAELKRIASLAIPPAYTSVWICPDKRGHIQATGRDARGRKQYRYHPDWTQVRDAAKFDRVLSFAHALPALRRRVRTDLRREGLPRERVVAGIVQLLESTLIRVGNEEYAKANNSFGLTTLRNRHVRGSKGSLRLRFRGKSGKVHDVEIHDRRLATLVRRCQDLPGQELFQYLDAKDVPASIGSSDVNAYLREATADEFSAKDVRTWHATVLAIAFLLDAPPAETLTERKAIVIAALTAVAEQLRNTRSVCKKCYVHPSIIEWYEDGSLARRARRGSRKRLGLDADESAALNALSSAMRVRRSEKRAA